MRVYTEKLTPRIEYAIQLVLRDVLNAEGVRVIDNWEAFVNFDGPKFIYGRKTLQGVPSVFNVELLFEKDIYEQDITVQRDDSGLPYFFSTGAKSLLPFDIFAASFYLVSRYEEYLPHISDLHDRFAPEESLAYKNDFLQTPVVNHWAIQFKKKILEVDPRWDFGKREYQFIPTVDVDNLYAYKGKGGFRTMGGFAKDLSKLNLRNAFRRFKALTGLMPDPYDTFTYQRELFQSYGLNAKYFILFSQFGEYDRNVPMYSRRLHEAVRAINDFFDVGIHPSYGSHDSVQTLQNEIRGLEEALRTQIKESRQHFLKLRMPETFRRLVDLGITDDYTMGYASQIGFRASICTPYKFYDLEMETKLDLTMHPFAAMDGTLIYYQNITAKQAWPHLQPIVDAVKEVDGTLITVWHNRIFSETEPEWVGWNDLFSKLLNYAKP